ncbi:MAG: dockerin type I repeat-containing protein [Phycisphaerales bacterium]
MRDLQSLYERRVVITPAMDERIAAIARAHMEGLRRRRMRMIVVRSAGGLAAAAAVALGVFMMLPAGRSRTISIADATADKSGPAFEREREEAGTVMDAKKATLSIAAVPPAASEPMLGMPSGLAPPGRAGNPPSTTGGPRLLVGDLNTDGTVNIVDAMLLARALDGRGALPVAGAQPDFNGDGVVDSEDVLAIAAAAVLLKETRSAGAGEVRVPHDHRFSMPFPFLGGAL